ncbi:MAG TPA: hypothetical protein VNM48_07145 [Chloroflexota bacterium]|nr:hypothetical protein [Chloroflexota bacterium]
MTLTKAQQALGGSAALLGAAAFAATLSLVPAYAQTPPSESASAIPQTAPNAAAPGARPRLVDQFAHRLAAKLGVPREQVEKALRELRDEALRQGLGRGQPGQLGRFGNQGRPRMAGRAGTEVVELWRRSLA